jgi:hypothetical protein
MLNKQVKSQIPLFIYDLDIYKSYNRSEYLSTKHSSYFLIYEELFRRFVGKKFTFVEIGILNGGSLFMWRDYFGKQARIIGIDLNPFAKRWEKEGFEVYIGDQSSPKFWNDFFKSVGNADVILDDGGHTNEQQVITTVNCIPYINDGGLLVVEDTHTSYMTQFGNPSKHSFINYTKFLIDDINSRFPIFPAFQNTFRNEVYSIRIFQSVVCFEIDKNKCFISSRTTNKGKDLCAEDFRHKGYAANRATALQIGFLRKIRVLSKIYRFIISIVNHIDFKLKSKKLSNFFR